MNEKLKLVLGRVENIVGKGGNAGYQHFLCFPKCFQKASFSWSLKVRIDVAIFILNPQIGNHIRYVLPSEVCRLLLLFDWASSQKPNGNSIGANLQNEGKIPPTQPSKNCFVDKNQKD